MKIVVCELETAHPCKSARDAGGPVDAPCDPGFVTGVGFGSVLPEMWPVANRLIDDTMTVSLSEVVNAIRLLAVENKNVCAVVSGGNLDPALLAKILRGENI